MYNSLIIILIILIVSSIILFLFYKKKNTKNQLIKPVNHIYNNTNKTKNQNNKQNSLLYLSEKISDNLPSMVKNELIKMPAQKQQEFVEEFTRRRKNTATGYVFILLVFGFHYAYLNKWGEQIIFTLTGGGLLIWWLVDLFRIPNLVKNYNKNIAIEVLRNMKALYSN